MKKNGIIITLCIILIVIVIGVIATGAILLNNKESAMSKKMKEIIITLTPNKDKKMISQVENIISQVKENKDTTINSIYYLKDIKAMGIEIPISPYGTDYSSGYITNFNGIYYVSMDNGKQKVSGNEDNLEFSKLGLFNWESNYTMSAKEAELLIQKVLKNKYDEEFTIVTLTKNSDIYGFHGYYATVQSTNNNTANTFNLKISNEGEVFDGYYDLLIEDEYKKLITEIINKVDNKAKIIGFDSTGTYPYGNEVSKNLSLEDALKNKIVSKYLFIVTYSNLTEDNIKQIEENLKDIHYRGHVKIFQTNRRTYLEVDNYESDKLESAKLYSLSMYE